MRCVCGYLMLNGRCPVCSGKQPAGLEPVGCIIPRALRAFFVVPSHFESRRHYHAWCAGIPIRSERARWKIPARTRELIKRQFGYRCQWPGCESGNITVEHKVPVAFGGSNDPGNLTLLCPTHQQHSWQRFQQLLSPNAGAA